MGKVLTKLEHGYSLRPAARLIDNFLQALGLETSSSVGTPCTKQEMRKDDERPLTSEGAALVKKRVGMLLSVAHDRADIAYAVKEVARGMKTPTAGDLIRLKRLCRYLSDKWDFGLDLTGDPSQGH